MTNAGAAARAIDVRLQKLELAPIGRDYVTVPLDELTRIEARLGGGLPGGYRHFASRYGHSGFSEMAVVQLLEPSDGHAGVPLALFFGGAERGASLLASLEQNYERFPGGVLPIGEDPFGNLFCLALRNDPPGGIWYANFDRQVPAPEGPGPRGEWFFETVLAATSFEDLLDRISLEPWSDE